MMDPARAALRDAVVADVRGGLTQREAAEKHKVPPGTVALWCAEAKKARGEKGRKGPLKGGKGGAKTVVAAAPPPRDPKPRRTITAELGPELRGLLRQGTRRLARFIAGEDDYIDPETGKPYVPNMQDVAHAARALDTLIFRAPDLLTFDERTQEPSQRDDQGAERVAEVFGVDLTAAPTLEVMQGGRVESS